MTIMNKENPIYTTVKEQHYIPQFYLKLFENKDHLIERWNVKENIKLKPRGKKGLCFEEFFYGINTGEKDLVSQIIEKGLKEEEDYIAIKLPNILENLLSDEPVSDENKYILARFMAMLYLRGPMFRSQINSMRLSGLKQFKGILSTYPNKELKKFLIKRYENSLSIAEIEKIINNKTIDPKFNNSVHLKMLGELSGFSNMMFGQEWLIFRNNTESPFISSDNPISPESIKGEGFRGPSFMDFTYHFALSPKLHIQTKSPKEISKKTLHRKTLHDEDEVLKLNLYVANCCIKEIYSPTNAVFKEISEVIQYFIEVNTPPSK